MATVNLGLASETDSAPAITPAGGPVTVAIGLATEVDSAPAITPVDVPIIQVFVIT
jgi:hypothetical protein